MEKIRSSFYLFSLLFLSLLGLNSCDIINPEETIPSFIYIEPFEFEAGPIEGTENQVFPYVQVLIGTENLGFHSVPSRIPLLLEGPQSIDLFPGISENGISSLTNVYNMIKFNQVEVDLEPTKVDTIQVTYSYKENLVFPIVEPFESELHVFREDLDGDNFTKIELIPEDAFEGNRSARITINKEHPSFDVASERMATLPPDGTLVYLEMNYKAENIFSVGVFWTSLAEGRRSSFTNFINPKEDWNKIYLNFSDIFDFINGQQGVTDWQIGISARIPIVDGELEDVERNVWFDNIKLIHFEP